MDLRSQKKIVVIHNAAFPRSTTSASGVASEKQAGVDSRGRPEAQKSQYTIMFTGRIYWPQIGALKNLVEAVKSISDLDIRLKFYCPNPKEYIQKLGFNSTKIDWSVAAPKEMAAIQSKADILFLPLSWGTMSPQIINTATPGKLTDYLIAGRPMLIHAPESTYLVRYARENKFAMIADQNDTTTLQLAIRSLLGNPTLGQGLVKNAQATFHKNHDANKNATIFAALFNS